MKVFRNRGIRKEGKLAILRWATLRIAVVTAAFFAGASSVPDIVLPWSTVGTFGFTTDSTGAVTRVFDDGLPRDSCDKRICAKEHIDVAATDPKFRRYLLDLGYAEVGTRATFMVIEGSKRVPKHLIARPVHFSVAEILASIYFGLAYLALIYTGTRLWLHAPSWMTFTFFGYAFMTSNWSWLLSATLRWDIYKPWASFEAFLYMLNWVPLSFFALLFPRGTLQGWRRRAIVPLVVLSVAAAVTTVIGVRGYWSDPTGPLTQLAIYEPIVGLFVALWIVIENYRQAKGDERARLRVVIWMLFVGDVCTLAATIATFAPHAPILTIWQINALSGMNIVVPIGVAYAILRYRLFGIAVTRAVGFSILAVSIVIIIREIFEQYVNGFVGRYIHAPIAEALLAILILMWFGTPQKYIERWINALHLRPQRRARRVLVQVAGDTSFRNARDAAKGIVESTAAELHLSIAALFRRSAGGFVLIASSRPPDEVVAMLADDDPVVQHVRAAMQPFLLNGMTSLRARLPDESEHSTVAVPVFVRNELEAIIFAGPHTSGIDLDPYDVKTLRKISASVGAGYERFKAQAEHESAQETTRTINELRDVLQRMELVNRAPR